MTYITRDQGNGTYGIGTDRDDEERYAAVKTANKIEEKFDRLKRIKKMM